MTEALCVADQQNCVDLHVGGLKCRELTSQISGLGTEAAFYRWCQRNVLLVVLYYNSVWKMVSSKHFLQKETTKVYL